MIVFRFILINLFYIFTSKELNYFEVKSIDSCGENDLDASSGKNTLTVVNTKPAKQITIASIPETHLVLIVEIN